MKEGCSQHKNSVKGVKDALSMSEFWKKPQIAAASYTSFPD